MASVQSKGNKNRVESPLSSRHQQNYHRRNNRIPSNALENQVHFSGSRSINSDAFIRLDEAGCKNGQLQKEVNFILNMCKNLCISQI